MVELSTKMSDKNKIEDYLKHMLTNKDPLTKPTSKFYARTSTPLPEKRNVIDFETPRSYFEYKKWSTRLKDPPHFIKVRGVNVRPKGIIAGHLVSDSKPEVVTAPNIDNVNDDEEPTKKSENEKERFDPKRIKALFADSGMTWLKRTVNLCKRNQNSNVNRLKINGVKK